MADVNDALFYICHVINRQLLLLPAASVREPRTVAELLHNVNALRDRRASRAAQEEFELCDLGGGLFAQDQSGQRPSVGYAAQHAASAA